MTSAAGWSPTRSIPDFAPLCPDLMLHHFDCVAAFDHMQERAWIISETPERADEMEALLEAEAEAARQSRHRRLAIELHARGL